MQIDLRSDTVTKPTQEMREAMLSAPVGDDVYGEDPTINRLEQLSANLLGKEAALFLTSGTQANQVAVLSQTQPGEEIILEKDSHLFYYETGGLASLAGVQARTLEGINGQMQMDDIQEAIRGKDIHYPNTSLIALENTHARSGGRILPTSYMKEVYNLANNQGISVHLDGARIFNAAIGLGVPPKEIAQYADTVQFCLSKGLSAPMGSILAGKKEVIAKARKWRKTLGGGTRQAGVVGAAGIIALEKMIDRLVFDHENAKELARQLESLPGLNIDSAEIESNIVILSVKELGIDSVKFVQLLKERGVLANALEKYKVRFVTHREIGEDDIKKISEVIRGITILYQ